MFQFQLKSFEELSVDEVYNILQLRENVFVIEQNCVYQDIDGIDKQCFHLFATDDDSQKLIAYARLVPANIKFDAPSIGRVITDKNYRGQGSGKALMQKAIEASIEIFKSDSIKISAQTYLFNFYSSFGFKPISPPYDEDGIEHVDMLLTV